MLKLYNTLTKLVQEVPKQQKLNLYTCGPTVYNHAHIGNLRTYISSDLLYRALKLEGYNPKWVMNITDIDDKTIKGAIEKHGQTATVENLRDFTKFYFDEFLKDLSEVNVLRDEIEFIRVTDVIPQIQEFIVNLMEKGYAYKAEDGSTYFSIEKYQNDFGDYGVLVGEKFLEGKKVGARVAVDEYEKENLSDFALWKAFDTKTDAQIFWDHKTLGKGRPGWHIECSAINNVGFEGEPVDIHTGAVDLMFPHHTNEIAQSQALFGKGNFVRHWSHAEHLLVEGKKMAKSANNFYTLRDVLKKGFSGMDFRYAMMASSYRAQQNFTWESLLAARNALTSLFVVGQEAKQANDYLMSTLQNDLNVPEAIGLIWKEKIGGKILEDLFGLKKVSEAEAPAEVKDLLSQRDSAKQQKDFAKSDELRKQIEDLGFEVMDTQDGQVAKKKIDL